MVDNTYRWAIVLLLTAGLAATLVPVSYRKGFPTRMPLQLIAAALVLVGIGAILAKVFNESLVDALLLRAYFGFMVPDTGVHGYGWFLIFGYAILLANLLLLAVGAVMVRLGRVPPWVRRDGNQEKGE